MKEIITILFGVSFSIQVTAQWLGANPVYFNSGNVGIGTSSPGVWFGGSKTLEFSDVRPVLKLSSTSPTGLSTIVFTNTSVNSSTHTGEFHLNYQFNQSSNDKSQLIFSPYPGSNALILQADGNVGIGTTSPTELLQVYSAGQYPRISVQSTSATGAPGFDLRDASGTPKFTWHYDIGNGFMGFFQEGVGNRMVINNNGSVGIGTSFPNAKLHIISQGAGTAGLLIQGQNGDNWLPYSDGKNYLRGTTVLADVGSNVGIGTPTPNAKLHINGNGGSNVDLLVNGRITTGDASSAGGMYVNSAQSMFVGQSSSTALGFYNNGAWRLTVDNNGSVGIGTTSPDAKLAVAGQIHAQEVKVSLTVPGPDYVFEKDYKLTSLEEIKNYIDQNKHLPEVPSAKEMEKNGIQLGEMNMLLLKKIEELTLYTIELNKRMNSLEKENEQQKNKNEELENLINSKQNK
jgi:hypothetical protein